MSDKNEKKRARKVQSDKNEEIREAAIARKLQIHYHECFCLVREFIDSVNKGTNLCNKNEIQESLLLNRKKQKGVVPRLIDDQADHHDDSSTHDDDDDDDDDDDEELENYNSLEAYKHPYSKDGNAKYDSKITFAGLTLHTEQQNACARAALFLYWPRGIFHLF
jgi:hypothetical protein